MNLSANEIVAITGIIVAIIVTLYAGMLYIILSGKIQTLARSEVEKEKYRMGANMLVDIGFVYWGDYQISKNNKFLEHAIRLTERAYSDYGSYLDESDSKNELLVCQIKNNLAYYYAKRLKIEDGAKARQYAEDILAKSHNFETLKRQQMLDTYKYVQRQFPESQVDIHLEKNANSQIIVYP
jgi:hypothetical protein